MLSDVEEFNKNKDKKEISLCWKQNAVKRWTKTRPNAKRARRPCENNGPLLEESDDTLAAVGEPLEATVDDEAEDGIEEHEDDDRPDLLLRESARIVGDMIELDGDVSALAQAVFPARQSHGIRQH